MATLNRVQLLGRLGKDPEFKATSGGADVCNFSLATSEPYTDKNGQKQEKTEWHKIIVWGKLGELCNKYMTKGSQCLVEGRLQTRSWEKDGVTKYMTEIVANNVQFLSNSGSKPETNDQDDMPF